MGQNNPENNLNLPDYVGPTPTDKEKLQERLAKEKIEKQLKIVDPFVFQLLQNPFRLFQIHFNRKKIKKKRYYYSISFYLKTSSNKSNKSSFYNTNNKFPSPTSTSSFSVGNKKDSKMSCFICNSESHRAFDCDVHLDSNKRKQIIKSNKPKHTNRLLKHA